MLLSFAIGIALGVFSFALFSIFLYIFSYIFVINSLFGFAEVLVTVSGIALISTALIGVFGAIGYICWNNLKKKQ